MFHSKLALVTKICFVAYKILNNFCFGEILAPVQILAEFCKTTEQVDMDCYSAEQGGALPPEQSRHARRCHVPGHAAACCCASRGRPHPQPALCRVDKAPGGRGIPFLLFEP